MSLLGVLKPYGIDEDVEASEYDDSDEELFQAIENGTVDDYVNKWLDKTADRRAATANRILTTAMKDIEKGALSGKFADNRQHRNSLIRRLKRKRKYGKPQRQFGSTAGSRSTFRSMSKPKPVKKHGQGSHDDETHGDWADGISQMEESTDWTGEAAQAIEEWREGPHKQDDWGVPRPDRRDIDSRYKRPVFMRWLEAVSPAHAVEDVPSPGTPEGDAFWAEYDALKEEHSALSRRWEHAIERAVTLGHLDAQDAKDLGWLESTGSEGKWGELPEQLFHVTTAADTVLSEGRLKTREELAIEWDEPGLGGGPSDTVSYTTDPKTAHDIAFTMKEAVAVARGEITFADLVERSRWGDAGSDGFYDRLMAHLQPRHWRELEQMSTPWQGVHDGVRFTPVGSTIQEASISRSRLDGSLLPNPDERAKGFPPDQKSEWFEFDLHGEQVWARTASHEEQIKDTWEAYRMYFLPQRQNAGGPLDPYIAHSNWEEVAQVDPTQIATIEFRSQPGTMGYQVSSLGEWRAFSGEGVEVVHATY